MWQTLYRAILAGGRTARPSRAAACGAVSATVAGGSFYLLSSSDSSKLSLPSSKIDISKSQQWPSCKPTHCEAPSPSTIASADARSTTKIFTEEEVSMHNGKLKPQIWVTYGGKVYDVTDFIAEHPGGDFILDAAGGPLENYWAYWAYHTAFDRPMNFLKEYEIGILRSEPEQHDDDEKEAGTMNHGWPRLSALVDEMYEDDPDRDQSRRSGQVMLLERPWCSETTPHLLGTQFTPNDAFYVRNHAPVPVLDDPDNFEVSLECDGSIIGGKNTGGNEATTMSLRSLRQRFPTVTITSILQCAGNRAADMIEVAPTAFTGTPWDIIQTGMIGNATWSGVRLRDVLLYSFPVLRRLTDKQLDMLHVEFEGVDQYRTSTPLRRILEKSCDALLAFEMNGEPLPPDHGFPVRAFLPGIAGARNVKWLHSIRIQEKECTSCFQQTYYLDPNGRAIQEMPIQCFITSKQPVGNSKIQVAGVAWGGGSGVGIGRVQVSGDDGKSWEDANLCRVPQNDSSREWSWVHFEAMLDLDPDRAANAPLPTVVSRAIDAKGLQQPEKYWYPKGYLSNGWHRM